MTEQQIYNWFIGLNDYQKWREAIGMYNPELDYAGPENNKTISMLIPATVYGIDCNPAFYQHDALYEIGGTEKERFWSDGAMLLTGLFIIEKWPDRWFLYGANWLRRHLGRVRLIKYFEAVRAGGKAHFNFRE